jgi:hypothetical protein
MMDHSLEYYSASLTSAAASPGSGVGGTQSQGAELPHHTPDNNNNLLNFTTQKV